MAGGGVAAPQMGAVSPESVIGKSVNVGDVLNTSIFMRLAGELPVLRTQSGLLRGLARYLECWLPLLALAGAEAENFAMPTDVAWIWFVHLITPQRYFRDVTKLTGKFPDFGQANPTTCALRPRGGEAWVRTATIWRATFPAEPFELTLTDDDVLVSMSDSLRLSNNDIAEFLGDLATSQLDFFYQVYLPHYQSHRFLEEAIRRYENFLVLSAKHPDEVLYPPCDIGLVWRTHMAKGVQYVRDTIQICRRMVVHHKKVLDVATGEGPDAMFLNNAKLYEQEFEAPFLPPGTLCRGHRPKMGITKARFAGTFYLDHACLQGLRLDGRSYRPSLAVSGMRGGAGAVRRALEQDSRGDWVLGKKMMIDIDGRAGAEITIEVALKQGKLAALTSRAPPRSFLTSLRLDANVSTAPATENLPLRTLNTSREEAMLHISYRVEKRPLRGSLTVIIKPSSAGHLVSSVGPASAEPFLPPRPMAEPLRRDVFLTDEDRCGLGTLRIEHYFDGLALQRRQAMVAYTDLSGITTACARLIGREELVDDPKLVWNRRDLSFSSSGPPSLVFLVTIGGRDWGLVFGTWQGYIGRGPNSPGEPGSLRLTVTRFLDDLDSRADSFETVIPPGRAPWKVYKGRFHNGSEDFMSVIAQPHEGVVTVGNGLGPEVGTILVCCASMLTLFLCPPPAIVAGAKNASFSGRLFEISGVEVGGLVGRHLSSNSLDSIAKDRLMEAVRKHFEN